MTRWCEGPCERELPIDAFVTATNGKGTTFRRRWCRPCWLLYRRSYYHRARKRPSVVRRQREIARAHYQRAAADPGFLKSEAARALARYYALKTPEFLASEAARKREARKNLGRAEGRGLVGAQRPPRQVTRIADTAKAPAPLSCSGPEE